MNGKAQEESFHCGQCSGARRTSSASAGLARGRRRVGIRVASRAAMQRRPDRRTSISIISLKAVNVQGPQPSKSLKVKVASEPSDL